MDSLGFFSGKLKNSKKLLKIMIICFWAIEVLFLSINIHKQIYIYIYREREIERERERERERTNKTNVSKQLLISCFHMFTSTIVDMTVLICYNISLLNDTCL